MLFVGCLLMFCLRFSVVLFCGGLFDWLLLRDVDWCCLLIALVCCFFCFCYYADLACITCMVGCCEAVWL